MSGYVVSVANSLVFFTAKGFQLCLIQCPILAHIKHLVIWLEEVSFILFPSLTHIYWNFCWTYL